MAALGRPFGGLPLSGASEFLPPPAAFVPDADARPAGPRAGSRGGASGGPGRGARGRFTLHCKKKHKREEEDDDCPVRKKRLTEAGLSAGPNDWVLCAPQQLEGHGVNLCTSALSGPGMTDVICEEMDQTTGEPQCEVARRKLQEIEDRIIDEDEEVEADRNTNHLPSLVLSDTMKTGLKREFDEVFTKKMIESMSRPSMELVLWKPLPELLSDKPKRSSNAKNYPGENQTKHATPATAFSRRTELFLEPQHLAMPVYNGLEAAACTEEEMEL
ncbi:coiled-coil domain-containing protein 117-like isoform X1 [Suncus etruscus]|uniref:coiled-coil domain-containing protein 117-like isoform X1 n=1 Tax=Suncus etruscus TaxID=109475 RepID=UPI002110544D|nr:coiled-coil domain-containing protein 117-like isoform X1 [Suncus etruscus]